MRAIWSSDKRRVLIETDLVKAILTTPIQNAATLARYLGCCQNYIYQVRALKRSRARVFIPKHASDDLRRAAK